jgi:aspartate aminotransferase
MNMKLTQRIKGVAPSATLAVTNRAKEMKTAGVDVVIFAAGEPDFDTPKFIKEAAKAALDAGQTKYGPAAGIPELRKVLANKLNTDNGLHVTPEQITITAGGKHALYNAAQVLLEAGDKLLIPAPYWVSYPEFATLAGAEPVIIPTSPESGFKITPEQVLEYGSQPGAKVLVVNSPSNPTGVCYTPAELAAIGQAVLKTDLMVFSDEIYEKLIYGDTKFVSFGSLSPELEARTVTFNGLSKTYAMTGWRLGWVAGPTAVVKAMNTLMSQQVSNVPIFLQTAAVKAYTEPQDEVERMRQQFAKRGLHMHQRLNAIDGVTCVKPDGAFYCFPDVSAHYGKAIGGKKVTNSLEFAAAVLETSQVALVPGGAFGEERCVRLSFATSMEQIDKGLDRLEKLLK